MNLLEFGMKNEDSTSAVKRALARTALAAAKKKADLYEQYLERREITLPEDDTDDMLRKIRDEIDGQE